MKRKTIEVEKIKEKVNNMILNSKDNYIEGRGALAVLLETILMDTGNYRGFYYLTPHDMKNSEYGTSYGIDFDKEKGKEFENTDRTRVFYY